MLFHYIRMKYFLLIVALLSVTLEVRAQVPEVVEDTASVQKVYRRVYRDSAFLARQKQIMDSVNAHAMVWQSHQNKTSPILDSILIANKHSALNPLTLSEFSTNAPKNPRKQGNYLPKGEVWALGFIAGFLVLFALLKYSFSRQLWIIIQSFFSNRILANMNKEDNLFSSWPFLLLFILFGFVIGMFYYLVSQYYQLAGGFRYFTTLSVLIVILYAGKIFLLKLLGFLFEVGKPVNEYISILYLSYFNTGLVFLPLVTAFALSPLKFGIYYIIASYIILGIIVGLQFIRASINVLSNYRFSKLYLLLYFCTFEICPILILIKAIR